MRYWIILYEASTGRVEICDLVHHNDPDEAWAQLKPYGYENDGSHIMEFLEHKEPSYPVYTESDDNLKPGLYLALFHGFPIGKRPMEINDWGANGAIIGVLEYIHTTYACDIKFYFKYGERAKLYGFDEKTFINLPIVDGCIQFDGMEYGDWTIFVIEKNFESEA